MISLSDFKDPGQRREPFYVATFARMWTLGGSIHVLANVATSTIHVLANVATSDFLKIHWLQLQRHHE
jgi:hypothetical protein